MTYLSQFSWQSVLEMLKLKSPSAAPSPRAPSAFGQRQSPFHLCDVCKKTEVSDPDMDFRYCPECGRGFCPPHMGEHKHPA